MRFEFATESGLDTDNRWANSARLLNTFIEDAGDGRMVVKSLLGTETFASVTGTFCRAMAFIDGLLYVVQGGALWRVAEGGGATSIGAVVDSEQTSISGSNGKVTIAAGGVYYVWDGTTLDTPSTGAFTNIGSVEFLGQLTVLTERLGRRVSWSDPALPKTIDPLNFATTETSDDDNIRCVVVGSELWIFKERSTERWYNSGQGLAVIPGSTIDRGLKSFGLMAKIPNGVFYVADDNRAYVGLEPVSSTALETAIAQATPRAAFYFEDEGNKFCVLTFDNRPAWVLNMRTGLWSERGEGTNFGPWMARACAKAFGSYFIGTTGGGIYKLVRNNQDVSGEMPRRIVSRTVEASGDWLTVSKLHIPARVGVYDTEPQLAMRMSGDYGQTWKVDRQVGLGAIGDLDHMVTFRRLGRYRQATLELTVSDPVDVVFDASLNL